jgi:putative transposase
MFKLAESASKKWRRLRGYDQIPLVILGKKFVDGTLQENTA